MYLVIRTHGKVVVMQKNIKKYCIVLGMLFFVLPLFAGGESESREQLTKTESNTAIFLNSINQAPSDDGSKNNTGDVRTSAGWLQSEVFTIYPDIKYSLKATVVVESASGTDKDSGGERVRMYLIPLTNTSDAFTLANAGGSALISVNDNEAESQPFIELGSGTHTLNITFISNETTNMRIVFEKGQLDWGNANNSKMAGQEVKVSNVILDYIYE